MGWRVDGLSAPRGAALPGPVLRRPNGGLTVARGRGGRRRGRARPRAPLTPPPPRASCRAGPRGLSGVAVPPPPPLPRPRALPVPGEGGGGGCEIANEISVNYSLLQV